MSRRIAVWLVLAAAMIGGSTLFGWTLTLAIGPKVPNYNRVAFGGVPVRPGVAITADVPVLKTATAFLPAQPPVGFQAQEFQRVLDSIERHLAERQFPALLAEFDTERMAEEEILLGYYDLFATKPTRAILTAVGADIARDIVSIAEQVPDTLPTGHATVLRIARSQDGQEALLVARHVDPSRGTRYVRWWLKRDRIGTWRVYDFDFPNTRLRFLAVRSYLLGAPVFDHLGAGAARNPDVQSPDVFSYRAYRTAFDWLLLAEHANDPAGQNAALWREPIDVGPQIPPLRVARSALRARLGVLAGNAAAARTALTVRDKDLAALANEPCQKLARAALLNLQKDYHGALTLVQNYRDNVGNDPIAFLEEAKAKAGLDGPNAAIVVLRQGLREFPGDTALAMALARRLPADEREVFGEELSAAGPAMLETAATLFEKQFPSILDALCTGYLRGRKDDPTALVIGVHAKRALGQAKSAGELLKRLKAPARRETIARILVQARFTKDPFEPYDAIAAAGDAPFAFRDMTLFTASALLVSNQPPTDRAQLIEKFQSLVAAHQARHAGDPWLRYASAVIFAASGDAAAADAELVAGLALLTPPTRTDRLPLERLAEHHAGDWEPFRSLRTELLARRGQWKQAYAELPPAVDTFDQLANRCALAGDAGTLAELIERHARDHAGDLELIAWRGELNYLRKEYANAVTRFRDYRDKSGQGNRQSYHMTDRLIRSLVRLQRVDEAAEVLEAAGDTLILSAQFPALIAAARGDTDAVMELFDRATGPDPTLWYADADLGPLLRGPAFARVRQKYPPPVP